MDGAVGRPSGGVPEGSAAEEAEGERDPEARSNNVLDTSVAARDGVGDGQGEGEGDLEGEGEGDGDGEGEGEGEAVGDEAERTNGRCLSSTGASAGPGHGCGSHGEAPAPAKRKLAHQRYRRLRIDLLTCRYDAVWKAARAMGWEPIGPEELDGDDWHIYWTDTSVSQERVMRLRPMQRLNHFPGMLELARKAGSARNLNRMLRKFPDEYKFFPSTWLLPADLVDFKAQFTAKKNKTFIVKPSRGCQGKDILLTRSFEGINVHENYIAQRYLHRPLLLDGYKFDLRIYVLVTAVDPLRIYVHREGMVRLCTTKYGPVKAENLEEQCMHLTNYAINKHADAYLPAASEDDTTAHKRLLSSVLARLEAEGEDVPRLRQLMDEIVVKTLISVQPHLAHTYYSCQQRSVRRSAQLSTAPASRPQPSPPGALREPGTAPLIGV